MTTTLAAPATGTRRTGGVLRLCAGRLLRLELKRNAMLWLVPMAAAMFWFDCYRSTMALPAFWPTRELYLQQGRPLVDFAPFVAGAAAWMGSRDGRRGTDEQVASTPLPRWAARLAAFAATAFWALAAYAACTAGLLAAISADSPRGELSWWPIAVGAVGVLAFTAVGFAAGAVFPSRFTVPLVAILALLLLILTQDGITHNATYGLLSPTNILGAPGPEAGVFYPYPGDLSIVQMLFMLGLTVAALGVLGVRAMGAGSVARTAAVVVTAAGLVAAGAGVQLAGTSKAVANGTSISAVHDSGNDEPINDKQVCDGSAGVQVCLSPVYQGYLANLSTALTPLFKEVAGLPGAPTRTEQVLFPYHGEAVYSTSAVDGDVLRIGLNIGRNGMTCFLTGPKSSTCVTVSKLWDNADLVGAAIRPHTAKTVVDQLVGGTTDAQQAVSAGLLTAIGVTLTDPGAPSMLPNGAPVVPNPDIQVMGPRAGTPVAAAAQRFAALTPEARHAWLAGHLTDLRAGHLTLTDLP
ncbi:hypothetical protein ACFYNO_24680 [Kitasatospora sp. NPDC006697]|uniref:hypothetical protein n=1 Tax=Kitasatospora sp. NPDC006697 TaxID=3364020 RepID=UPI0036CA7EAD